MKQYNAIKEKYPDALLLFRVGDFYETFGDDAVKTARILNIVLTNRNNGSERTELAGFPHHSLNTYLPKLVRAGERVAICDQLENPSQTKKIVKRGVTELVTPGVSYNDEVLQSKSNNFLAAIYWNKTDYGVAFLDASTGDFFTAEGQKNYIDKLLQNFEPSEVLIPKQFKSERFNLFDSNLNFFFLDDWVFNFDYAHESLNEHFQTKSLKGFGISDFTNGIIAASAVLHYLNETRNQHKKHISSIKRLVQDEYVWMDHFTIKNLELYQGNASNAIGLVNVIDHTISAMGSRMLKRWLALPLKTKTAIEQRHDIVQTLLLDPNIHEKIVNQLQQINDLERLISKVSTNKITPRETLQLQTSLNAVAEIKNLLRQHAQKELKTIGDTLNPCHELRETISKAIHEDAPVNISKGNAIAKGYSDELDELRHLANSGKSYLDEMLKRETEETGISSLKIASNNVFGYYIEVRNTHKDKVPETWTRKQTLVNSERYITEELKNYEAKILGAEEKIQFLELELFNQLVEWIQNYIKVVQENARIIGQLDCLCGFAQLAKTEHYTKPVLDETFDIEITEGRHPVIEKQLPAGEQYISNSISLNHDQQQIIMITGPNMSGKSAILRQTALIVLLAQIGCFVPAKAARIGIIDKLFTRVGASDNISQGESTFMVEMNETASILNNLSDRSLIILDEIGRGTSTYDGISIAWAISEFLHKHPAKPKTLFATHYHELNSMADRFERIKNFNVSVKELKDQVLFLRKLVEGGSAHSFGIHVAKMAGMPQFVLQKANTVLKKLEESRTSEDMEKQLNNFQDEEQLSFFKLDDPLLEDIRTEIVDLDINTLTPVEALMKLNEIKRKISN
ncbi:DNA mismatch repair protein MutS [Psychroflexus sp. ALD_RP9]|uniref:DNA mismatch repair protein MutS n=1 Tax=Psychroflexus sp. ALD_RP9 TaxID=2777186 RepID=UPI001A8F7DEB|nr:DNA mismatch repair protein MutS [Psychroflexus sp. ALD_RP9]QSS97103.1 DNA mismatch repair protein MutS [Psychroflexus sp. ALD_RP9]